MAQREENDRWLFSYGIIDKINIYNIKIGFVQQKFFAFPFCLSCSFCLLSKSIFKIWKPSRVHLRFVGCELSHVYEQDCLKLLTDSKKRKRRAGFVLLRSLDKLGLIFRKSLRYQLLQMINSTRMLYSSADHPDSVPQQFPLEDFCPSSSEKCSFDA